MRGVALLMGLLALLLPFGEEPARAEEKPLRALVYDYEDPHSKATGAREALEAAGFEVTDLDPTAEVPSGADLIVLGSFVSEHIAYKGFVAARAKELRAFAERGGVVLQMTQADQTERAPRFLQTGLAVVRSDEDAKDLHVMAADHPLLAGLERDENDATRLAVRKYGKRQASWQSFVWQEGFRVLLASTPERDRYALLEAPLGKGRVLLSSLHFDKLNVAAKKGAPKPYSKKGRPHSDRFFANLATYVKAVRDGSAPDVTPTPPPQKAEDPPLGGPATPEWRLARSDMAQYVRSKIVVGARARYRGASSMFAVHGHHLDAQGQYRPAAALRSDLAGILALRLPPAGKDAEKLDLLLEDMGKLVPVRARGNITANQTREGELVFVRGSYTFASKGRGGKTHANRIEKGTAEVRALFDPLEGVFRKARIELEYGLVKLDAGRGEKPKRVKEHWVWKLGRMRRHRYETFQQEVDAAIDAGVAWLREERDDKGKWKPHGAYDIGSQALAALTLVACDVPRDDPAVTETLDWIFTQTPKKNYERAVCLMAIDEAYAPAGTGRQARRKSGPPPDLSPERMKWCERVAKELEEASSQPGSWGYPNKGNELMRFDTSNTQYAVLGLRAAAHLGIAIKEKTWLGVLRHFEIVREKGGPKGGVALVREGEAIRDEAKTTQDAEAVKSVTGYRYSPLHNHRDPWASMTCAAIASLSIARHQLALQGSKKMTARNEKAVEQMILGGWGWLDAHWALDRHPRKPGGKWYYYFLYSLERAGILHGVKRVGGKDWYFEGSCELIARQKDDGGWSEGKKSKMTATCFALLFLKRATAPLTGR